MKLIKKAGIYADRLRRAYKYAKESKLFYEPKLTPLGFKFFGHREMEQGIFEPDETKLVTELLDKVDQFINIGANIGYYACLARQKKVYSIIFEPMPSNLILLQKNLLANGFKDGFEIFPMALSNRTGLLEMYGSGTGASLIKGWDNTPDYYVTLVPVSTVDTVIGSRCSNKQSFVLIDVEGAEKLVLEGAKSLLKAAIKPVWMIEIATTEHQPAGFKINPDLLDTFNAFWENGYEAWTASNVVRLIEKDELMKIVAGEKSTLPGNNNFLFIEKGRKSDFLQ